MMDRDGPPTGVGVRRPRRIEVLLDQRVLDDAPTQVVSDALPVEDYRRFALYLRKDGLYRLVEHKDRNDFRIFQAALNVAQWKEAR